MDTNLFKSNFQYKSLSSVWTRKNGSCAHFTYMLLPLEQKIEAIGVLSTYRSSGAKEQKLSN